MNQINRLIIAVVFSVSVAVMAFWPGGQDEVIADKPGEVEICHVLSSVGYGPNEITIIVPEAAVAAYAAHGDYVFGPCPSP